MGRALGPVPPSSLCCHRSTGAAGRLRRSPAQTGIGVAACEWPLAAQGHARQTPYMEEIRLQKGSSKRNHTFLIEGKSQAEAEIRSYKNPNVSIWKWFLPIMYTETQMLKIPPKIMAHRHKELGNKGNSQYGQVFISVFLLRILILCLSPHLRTQQMQHTGKQMQSS